MPSCSSSSFIFFSFLLAKMGLSWSAHVIDTQNRSLPLADLLSSNPEWRVSTWTSIGSYGQICDVSATGGNDKDMEQAKERLLAHILSLNLSLVLQGEKTTAAAAGILPIFEADIDAELANASKKKRKDIHS
jgi:hypothetical protein